MNNLVDNLRLFITDEAPRLLIAIAIAVVGWVVAVALGGLVRRTIQRSHIGQRIATAVVGDEPDAHAQTARWAGRLVYWVVVLFVLLGLLQYVELTAATEPITTLLNSVFEFVPRLIGATAIFLFALMLATVIRKVVRGALERWGVDDVMARQVVESPKSEPPTSAGPAPAMTSTAEASAEPAAEPAAEPLAETPSRLRETVASGAFWLTLLVFMPAVLGSLQLTGLLEPAEGMLDEILAYLPNLGSAALILALGWFVARVSQRLATTALSAAGLDRLGARVGVSRPLGRHTPSTLAGLVIYALLLIPVGVATLSALQLDAVTAPASRMLQTFLDAVPALFGASLILVIAYVVGRLLSATARNILAGMGFDSLMSRLGIASNALGERTLSGFAGSLVMLVVMVFAVIEGARLLGLEAFADVTAGAVVLGGHVLLGLIVFGAGVLLASLAADAIRASGLRQAAMLSKAARAAIVILAGAVALRQMGLANEIIELAFGIGFGAVAVAAALAFGIGGREAAARTLEQARQRMEQRAEAAE